MYIFVYKYCFIRITDILINFITSVSIFFPIKVQEREESTPTSNWNMDEYIIFH